MKTIMVIIKQFQVEQLFYEYYNLSSYSQLPLLNKNHMTVVVGNLHEGHHGPPPCKPSDIRTGTGLSG